MRQQVVHAMMHVLLLSAWCLISLPAILSISYFSKKIIDAKQEYRTLICVKNVIY